MVSKSKIAGKSGFTLIEIIIALVAAGILAIFYFHFMGTAMDFSWESVELVAGEAKAEGLMDKIISDYVIRINQNPDTALAQILALEATYESDADFGSPVTMEYVNYDSSGNLSPVPSPGTSNNLRITVEAPGSNFTTMLTKSRNDNTNPIAYY
jgi:prepilin-type N-terminal cleavage/methylation domain-containing protein